MNESGETWYVKLPNGDVHPVSVDQLDWAFENGHIDANTLVLSAGSSGWSRLGEVAGLDEEAPSKAVAPAPPPALPSVIVSAPSARPVQYAAPYAAPVRPATSIAPQTPFAGSLRPVSVGVDDFDLNEVPFKPRSRKGWVVALLAFALVGGGIGVAPRFIHLGHGAASQSAAAQPPPPAETHVPYETPLPPATPQPASPPASSAAAAADTSTPPRFTDAQKQRLTKADKQHDEKAKARHSGGGAAQVHTASKYKSMGFTTGGNKYDPLNASF